MKRLIFGLAFGAALSTAAFAANPLINCGSTYYIPLKQISTTGTVSALPAGVVPVISTDATKITASIGTMPSSTTPAAVLKPIAAATGVPVTVTDSAHVLTPGSIAVDTAVAPSAFMLDIANMQSTTP